MQTKNFSIPQAFKFAVSALFTWHNVSKFLLLHALSFGVTAGGFLVLALFTTGIHLRYILNPQQFMDIYKNYFTTAGAALVPVVTAFALFALFILATYFFVAFCSIKMSLDIYDTGRANLTAAATTTKHLFFKLLGLSFLVMLGTFAGFILIIPGIIFMLSSLFAVYILVDKNSGIMAALRASWALTKGIRLKLFGFLMLFVFSVGVPVALLDVLFRTVFLWKAIITVMRYFVFPIISQLMMAFIYRSLQRSNIH